MGKIRQKLVELTTDWRDTGLPPARELLNIGQALLAEKKKRRLVGLWSRPPSMVTATMDDGWGAGLESVRLYAEIAGVEVIHLGLLLEPEAILAGCLRRRPDLLGLTVLHFETEEILTCHIMPAVPPDTVAIVGGPIFKSMEAEELAEKPYRVAGDLIDFIDFLLDWPGDKS
ncbi:MAG: hypothetical protein R6U29_08955 [Desulfosudaceae bacterium]